MAFIDMIANDEPSEKIFSHTMTIPSLLLFESMEEPVRNI